MKFKVGDRVKTNNSYTFDPNIGIIVKIRDGICEVKVDGKKHLWSEDCVWNYLPKELELIDPQDDNENH